MPLDFPNPNITPNFTSGTRKWEWSGEQWAAKNIGSKFWKTVTSTYTAVNNDRIAANTSGGAFTITLPASPTFGTNVTFADQLKTWDTNNLTINGNGSTIEGDPTLICDVVGDMTMTLLYNGSTWRVYV